jgi:integrase
VREEHTEAIQVVHESMAATPYAANNWLSTVSAMIEVALTKPSIFGLTENPAQKVPRFGKKSGAGARQQHWEDDREKTFLSTAVDADWEIYVSYFLLVYTGQRPIDCLKMAVADYDGVKIKVVQQKTGTTVWIKVHSRPEGRSR